MGLFRTASLFSFSALFSILLAEQPHQLCSKKKVKFVKHLKIYSRNSKLLQSGVVPNMPCKSIKDALLERIEISLFDKSNKIKFVEVYIKNIKIHDM